MTKVALAIALALAAGSALANEGNTLRFGVDPTYPPFEAKTPDGKLTGFDIDLGNAICARLKARCSWLENSFDGMVPALKARKFDAILSSMRVTEQRQKQIAFSDKLYGGPSFLVTKKDSALQPTGESLKGERIGVQQGSVQETYAKAHWESMGVNVVPYQNADQIYQDLVVGRLDGTVQPGPQADLGFLKTARGQGFAFAGQHLVDAKLFAGGVAIGLRQEDTALRQAINGAIAGMLKDGSYQKMASKYFSFDIYHDQ